MSGLTSNPSWLYNGSPQLTCFLWLAIAVTVIGCTDGLQAGKHIIYQVYVGQYFQYDLLLNMTWYNRPKVTQIKIYNSTATNEELPDWLEVGNDYSLHGLPLDISEGHFTILLFCNIENQNVKLCHSINLHLNVVHSQYSLYHSIEKYRETSKIKNLDNCLSDSSKIFIHTVFLSPQNVLTPLHLLNILKNLTHHFDYDISLMQVSIGDSPYIFYKQLRQLSIHTSNAVLEFENLTIVVSWAFSCSHALNHHHIRRRSLENNVYQSVSINIRSWHKTSGVLNRQKREVVERIFFSSITAFVGTPIETPSIDSTVQTTSSFISSRILNATSVSYNASAGQSIVLSINTNSLSRKTISQTFDSVGSKSSIEISYFFTRYENISRTVSVIKSTNSDNITSSASSNLVGSFQSLSTLVPNLTTKKAFPSTVLPTNSLGNITQSFLVHTRSKRISRNMILNSTAKTVSVNISASILTVASTEITDRTYIPPSTVTVSAYLNSTFLLKTSHSLAMTYLSYFTIYKPSSHSTAYRSLINASQMSRSLISSLKSKIVQSITTMLSSISSSYSFVTSVIRTMTLSSLTKTKISKVSVSNNSRISVLSLALTHYSAITSSSILMKTHGIGLKNFSFPFNRSISSIQTLVIQTISHSASSASTLLTSVFRLHSVPSSIFLVSTGANTLVVPISIKASFSISFVVNSSLATKNLPMSSYLKVATFSSSRNFTQSILVVSSSRVFASNSVNTMKSNTFSSLVNRDISSNQTLIVQTVSQNLSSASALFTRVSKLHYVPSSIFSVSTGANTLLSKSIKASFSLLLVVNSSLATNRLSMSSYLRIGTLSSSGNLTQSTLLVSYSSVIVSNSINTIKSNSFLSSTNRSISSIHTLFLRTLSLNTLSAPTVFTSFSTSHTVSRGFMSVSTSSDVTIASLLIVPASLKASFSINSFINTLLATKKLSTSSYTRVATLPPSRNFTQSILLISSRVVVPDSINASSSTITGMSSRFSYGNRNEVSTSVTSASSTHSVFYKSSSRSVNQTVRLSLIKLLSCPTKELTLATKHMNETLPVSNYVSTSRMSVLFTSFTNISFESSLSKSSHTGNVSLVFSTSASRRKLFDSTLVTQPGTIISPALVLTSRNSIISSQIVRVTTSEMFKSSFALSVQKSSLSKSTTSKKSHSRQLSLFIYTSRLIFKSISERLLNETVMSKLESVRFSTTLLLTSSVKLSPVSKRIQNLTHITSLGSRVSSISVGGYRLTSAPVISSKKIAMRTISPSLPHSTLTSLSLQLATPDSRSSSTASSSVVKNTITSVSSARSRIDFTQKTLLHNSSIIYLVKRTSKTYIFSVHVSSQHISVLPTISTTVNTAKLFSFTSDMTPSTNKLSSEISSNFNLTKTVASSSLTVTASSHNVSVTPTISSIVNLTKLFFSVRSDTRLTTTVMSFESSQKTSQRKTIQSASNTFLATAPTLISKFARSTSKINILTESVNSSRNRSMTVLSELMSAKRNRTSRIKESLSTSERRSIKSVVANRTIVSLKHSARISSSVYITQFISYASSELSPVRSNFLSRRIPTSSPVYSLKTFNTLYSAAQTKGISSKVFSKLTEVGIVTTTLSITTSLGVISSANPVSKLLTSSNIIPESSQKSFIATEDTSYVIFSISRSSRTTVNLVTSVSHLSVNTLSIKILPTSELPVTISPLKAFSLSVRTLSVSITRSIFLPSPINSSAFLVRSSVPRTSSMVFTLSIKVSSRLPGTTFPITSSKQVVMSLSPTISSSLGISTSVSTYTSPVTISLAPSSPLSVILSSVAVSKLSTMLSVITISKPSTEQKPITTTELSFPSSTTSSELQDLPSTLRISGFSAVRPLLSLSRSSVILSETSVTRSKAQIILSSPLTIFPSQVTVPKVPATSMPMKTSKISVLSSLKTTSKSRIMLSAPSITRTWVAATNVSYKPSLFSTSVLSVMKSAVRTSKLSVLPSLVSMSELPVTRSTTMPSMLTILPSSGTTRNLSTILSLLETSTSAAFPSFVTTSTAPVIQSPVTTIKIPVLQSSVKTSKLEIKLSSPITSKLVEISPWTSPKLLFISLSKSTTRLPLGLSTLTTSKLIHGTSSMAPITTTSLFVQSTARATKAPNNPPKLVSPIPHLFAETGYLFQYKIKEATFDDTEDGSTRNLTLKILFLNNESLSNNSWLAFNTSSQMLYGLPLKSDYKKQSSKPLDLILFAYDKAGSYASNSFKLSISEPISSPPFIVTIRLALNYTIFMREKRYPALLINKIASYYNDSQSRVYIQSIQEGSTLVSWSNTSFGINNCNNTEIESNTGKIINKNLNTPRKDFVQHLLPEFPVIGIQSELQGACVVKATIVTKSSPPTTEKDNTFLYFIIPVVILGIILLIVVILIIWFWKSRRKNTVYLKNQFLSHERPVLLRDEIELRQVSEVASHEKEVPYKRGYDDINAVHDHFESSSSFSSEASSISSNSMSMDIRGPPPPYRMPPKYIKPV